MTTTTTTTTTNWHCECSAQPIKTDGSAGVRGWNVPLTGMSPGHFSLGWNVLHWAQMSPLPIFFSLRFVKGMYWKLKLRETIRLAMRLRYETFLYIQPSTGATHSSAIINSPPQFPRSQDSALRLCTFTRLRERNRPSHNICSTCKSHNSSLNTHNSWSYVWCLTEFGMNRRFWATALSGDTSSQASDCAEMSPGDVSVRGHFSLVHRQGGVGTDSQMKRSGMLVGDFCFDP